MRAELFQIKKHNSEGHGEFYCALFRGSDGKSYKSYLYPAWKGQPVRNFARWEPLVVQIMFDGKKGILLDGLILKAKGLIDADSLFRVVEQIPAEAPREVGAQAILPITDFQRARNCISEGLKILEGCK